MSMLGLRDLLLIAPTPSLHHHHQQAPPISVDHHHHHHVTNLPLPSSAALSVGLGFFPVLTATPCMPHHHPHTTTNNDVENQQECAVGNNNPNPNYWNLKMCPEVVDSASAPTKGVVHHVAAQDESGKQHLMLDGAAAEEEEEEDEESNGIYGPGFRACQDCGNRAKKDCSYRRCRTCCKGRRFDCGTHVKSTWVPASRRRERDTAALSGDGAPVPKRPRAFGGSSITNAVAVAATTSHSSTSNATTTKSFDTSSCHQDAGFKRSLPGHVRAAAVFRCHRVSAIGNGEDEFAYLATVRISGHVFKGFLYDQGGVHGRNEAPCVSELQLGNKNGGGECSSAIGVPTATAYPASAC